MPNESLELERVESVGPLDIHARTETQFEAFDEACERFNVPLKFRPALKYIEGVFLYQLHFLRQEFLRQKDGRGNAWAKAIEEELTLPKFREMLLPILVNKELHGGVPHVFKKAGIAAVECLTNLVWSNLYQTDRDIQPGFDFIKEFFAPVVYPHPEQVTKEEKDACENRIRNSSEGQFMDLYKFFLLYASKDDRGWPENGLNHLKVLQAAAFWQGVRKYDETTEKVVERWLPFYRRFKKRDAGVISRIAEVAHCYLIKEKTGDGMATRFLEEVSSVYDFFIAQKWIKKRKDRQDWFDYYLALASHCTALEGEAAQFPVLDAERAFEEIRGAHAYGVPLAPGLILLGTFVIKNLKRRPRFLPSDGRPVEEKPEGAPEEVEIGDLFLSLQGKGLGFDELARIFALPSEHPWLDESALPFLEHYKEINQSHPLGALGMLYGLDILEREGFIRFPSRIVAGMIRCFGEQGGPPGIPKKHLGNFLIIAGEVFRYLREDGAIYLQLGALNPNFVKLLGSDLSLFKAKIEATQQFIFRFYAMNLFEQETLDHLIMLYFRLLETPYLEPFMEGLEIVLEQAQRLPSATRFDRDDPGLAQEKNGFPSSLKPTSHWWIHSSLSPQSKILSLQETIFPSTLSDSA